jgi:hypothetical protein
MFHRGATAALAMVLLHYPRDLELNDVTKGFASNAGPITMERVKELLAEAMSFADRMLVAADFMPYQASQEAPGDQEPEHRDLAADQPFRVAHQGTLTTFVVNEWFQVDAMMDQGEASVAEATN